jgi:hypothetical protein
VSVRWPVVKTIAESLSQHDEKHVVPTPPSGIRVRKRREVLRTSIALTLNPRRDISDIKDTRVLSLYVLALISDGRCNIDDGEIDRDVKNRMNAGWMKWRQVSGTTCDRRMPLKLKVKIYKTIIRPVVLYGSECWATKVRDE